MKETARLTDKKIELNEELKELLDEKLRKLRKIIEYKPLVTITYFIKDKRKDGGKYITVTSNLYKIDEFKNIIILKDLNKNTNNEIPINDILEIE